MKKQTILSLTILSAALVIGYASHSHLVKKEAKATDPVTYIEMKASSFTDAAAADAAGEFEPANATYWPTFDGYKDEDGAGQFNYPFYAMDKFFCGERKESWTGTITLNTWTQYTQYVYFTWGGARDIDNKVRLEFHYGTYTATMVNNTWCDNAMLLRCFKIPDAEYALLDSDGGFDMYINLIDEREADYGFHNFGYLHVNQTKEQVADAMRLYLNNMFMVNDFRPSQIRMRKVIQGHYYANDSLKEVFTSTVSNVNEDFENNTNFLNHWYLDANYDNYEVLDRHPDKLLCSADSRSGLDYSNMPYNKRGSKFFRGWYENGEGYVGDDKPIYRFISRPFVLSGTGLVSIRMAGRSASLHVIDTETQEDLAWADLRTFNTSGDEKSQYLGFNTVTMVKHYVNLSQYLGKTIQLALADVYVEPEEWASSYFDDLVTYYEDYPALGIDTTSQQCGEGTQNFAHLYYVDQYISSTHIDNDPDGLKYKKPKEEVTAIDESPINSAYKFLKHYYSALRSSANEFKFENASADVKTQIANEYKALTTDAKTIVNKSTDLQYLGDFSAEWWKGSFSTGNEISTVIEGLVNEFGTYTVSFSANGGTGSMASTYAKGEYILPANSFIAPEGKVFAGWKVGSGEELLQPGEKITVTADTSVVAQWKDPEVIKYTVTFNANGGSGTMNSVQVTKGEQLELPVCTFIAPDGKEFDCWIVRNELYAEGELVDIISNTEVFAKWKNIKPTAETYTVSFSANGGTGSMVEVAVNKDEEYELPENGFTAPEGFEFDCWLIGDEKYQPGAKVSLFGDVTLVASWKTVTPTPDPVTPDPVTPDPVTPDPVTPEPEPEPEVEPTPEKKGCRGSILSASVLISTLSLMGFGLLLSKKKRNN